MRRVLVLGLLSLTACTRPPANLAGTFSKVTVGEAQAEPREGETVRWGGRLISMKPGKDQTCFEIAGLPLDHEARPEPSDESPGRFIACSPGFYEPMVYAPGREVTVVGALHGTTVRKVGDYDYTYPRVDATTVHLWPERSSRARGGGYPQVGISIGGIFW